MIITKVDQAVSILQRGGLVGFPTETVYGLGADAQNADAVAKIFSVKQRPKQHSLIVHIADIEAMSKWARTIPEDALRLAEHFWPGPLTLILPKQAHVLDLVTANQDSIGLRIPNHPLALSLLKAFGGGVAAPSANKFTHISPTSAQAVIDELGDKVDAVIEGGACAVGVESTIIDFTQAVPRLLRPGMIKVSELSEVIGKEILFAEPTMTAKAPGQHFVHYAPRTPTCLIATDDIANQVANTTKPIALLCHSQLQFPQVSIIAMPNNANAYAHSLYHTLRELDQGNYAEIWIETPPQSHDWDAINDRVGKACGRR